MRSLLSQFRTPTAPRSAVGFFRSSRPAGRPALLITQSTSDRLSIIVPTLSTVDAIHINRELKNVNANYWCNSSWHSCAKWKIQIVAIQIFI
jgi:hypothetical protein